MNIEQLKRPSITATRNLAVLSVWQFSLVFYSDSLCVQMGVSLWWKMLREERALRYFDYITKLVENRKVAIDNSVYLHMFCFLFLEDIAKVDPDFTGLVRAVLRNYNALKNAGAHLLVVLEGACLPGKLKEEEKRHSGRDAIRLLFGFAHLPVHWPYPTSTY
jgi:hypothetical protein